MSDLYEIVDWPHLEEPVLLLGLEGWIDAGLAVATTVAHIDSVIDPKVVASFDTEILLDHRARRPIVHLEDGVNKGITWPKLELRAGHDMAGRDVLLLSGPEPDIRWKGFAEDVMRLAQRVGTTMMIGLGAYPSGLPHTRPVRLSSSASSRELAEQIADTRTSIDAPAGAQAIVEHRFTEAGIPNLTVWAQVPNYVSGMAFPAASVALLDAVERLSGLRFERDALDEAATALTARVDELVRANPEHTAMLREMERAYDEAQAAAPIPSGDELVAEVEQFLRDIEGGTSL